MLSHYHILTCASWPLHIPVWGYCGFQGRSPCPLLPLTTLDFLYILKGGYGGRRGEGWKLEHTWDRGWIVQGGSYTCEDVAMWECVGLFASGEYVSEARCLSRLIGLQAYKEKGA